MIKLSASIVFFLFVNISFLGCKPSDSSNSQSANVNNQSLNIQTENLNVENKPEEVVGKSIEDKFTNCWTNGRGELLRIDKDKMLYGYPRKNVKDSPKPVKFIIENSYQKDLVLIKLINRPGGFIYQDYVTFRYKEEKVTGFVEIKDNSFTSYEDYLNDKKSGYGSWVKDDCKKWY